MTLDSAIDSIALCIGRGAMEFHSCGRFQEALSAFFMLPDPAGMPIREAEDTAGILCQQSDFILNSKCFVPVGQMT